MAVSQNGWTANDVSLTQNYTIGNGRQIRLRKGDAGFLLKHFADWFDAKVEDIDQGILDDWGYAEREIRDGTALSNHASGTAMDLNATKHPLGARGTFPAAKADGIRQRLKLYDGVIRWGGDYVNRADEMHFEIVGTPAQVTRVATSLREGAAEKPAVAPVLRTPTVADLVVTLKRLEAASQNPTAKQDIGRARLLLEDIQGTTRISTPTTLEGVRKALRAKLLNDLTPEQRRHITSAYDLIRGI